MVYTELVHSSIRLTSAVFFEFAADFGFTMFKAERNNIPCGIYTEKAKSPVVMHSWHTCGHRGAWNTILNIMGLNTIFVNWRLLDEFETI